MGIDYVIHQLLVTFSGLVLWDITFYAGNMTCGMVFNENLVLKVKALVSNR